MYVILKLISVYLLFLKEFRMERSEIITKYFRSRVKVDEAFNETKKTKIYEEHIYKEKKRVVLLILDLIKKIPVTFVDSLYY